MWLLASRKMMVGREPWLRSSRTRHGPAIEGCTSPAPRRSASRLSLVRPCRLTYHGPSTTSPSVLTPWAPILALARVPFPTGTQRGRHGFEEEAEVARARVDRRKGRRFPVQRVVGKELLRRGGTGAESRREDEQSERPPHRRRTRLPGRHQNSLLETSLMLQIQRMPSRLFAMSKRSTTASWRRTRNPMPPL